MRLDMQDIKKVFTDETLSTIKDYKSNRKVYFARHIIEQSEFPCTWTSEKAYLSEKGCADSLKELGYIPGEMTVIDGEEVRRYESSEPESYKIFAYISSVPLLD